MVLPDTVDPTPVDLATARATEATATPSLLPAEATANPATVVPTTEARETATGEFFKSDDYIICLIVQFAFFEKAVR